MTFFGHSMVILHQNDLQMKKWCWNDRDENTLILASFLSNDPGMNHFSHSDIIPSFRDEDEWDDVDHFPYREKESVSVSFRFWASSQTGATMAPLWGTAEITTCGVVSLLSNWCHQHIHHHDHDCHHSYHECDRLSWSIIFIKIPALTAAPRILSSSS